MYVRRPAVAGSFYPSDADELRKLIAASYTHELGPGVEPPSSYSSKGIISCVCPHAGYVYSGPVAAHSYLHISSLRSPELAVIVAPNHYGVGSGIATLKEGRWETPLGPVPIHGEAVRQVVEATGIVDYDPEAHRIEHSLEVQLPFLQALYADVPAVVPISLAFQDVETAKALGDGLAKVLRGRNAILIASSDLTHYESEKSAKEKDMPLLKNVEELDVDGFYATLERMQVTACGYGAIATVMQASRRLGFGRAELLKYANSGNVTGDRSSVVGYAALRFLV